MRKVLVGLALGGLVSCSALAEGLSGGQMELSVNAIRSDGLEPVAVSGNQLSGSFVSTPIRLGYRLNDQFTLLGGFYIGSIKVENGNSDATNKSMAFTAGVSTKLSSGLMLEGSWTRLMATGDTGAEEFDFVGNHFEGFLGRRFQAANGLFIEPKAGVTFGTVELDDSDVDFSVGDGLGTEIAITLGYVI